MLGCACQLAAFLGADLQQLSTSRHVQGHATYRCQYCVRCTRERGQCRRRGSVVARATTAVLMFVASTRADEQPAEDAAVDIRELPELRQRLSSGRVRVTRQSCERRVQIPPRSQCQQWPRSRSGVGGGGTGSDVRARYQRKPRPQCPHGSMRSSECEESGRKLVPGFTRAGRTEGRSGRRRIASLLLRGKPPEKIDPSATF